MTVEDTLAQTLQRLREQQGYTQRDVGEALGVSQAAVSRWETVGSNNRTPSTKTMSSLTVLYGTSLPAVYSQVDSTAKSEVPNAIREKARQFEQQINQRKSHGNGN
jgi:transcriptional regulator with XRE-family HTH domain